MNKIVTDILVIGGGIAGASVAASLITKTDVCLVEAEENLGYHSTGRSVAVYAESYGSRVIRQLTKKSSPLFKKAERDLTQNILSSRGFLFIAREDQSAELEKLNIELNESLKVSKLGKKEAQEIVPALRSEYLSQALYDSEAQDIDVSLLHNYYIQRLKEANGTIHMSQRVKKIDNSSGQYIVECDSLIIYCNKIVNAAGAWADQVAELAGCKKIGLRSLRRTAFSFDEKKWQYSNWPVVIDCEENFYIKPETGSIIGSPADEINDVPRDVYPEEYDIALGMDRIKNALDFEAKSIGSSWAGLRTFTPDRDPAVGFDYQHKDFFWLAGQGGYGIQTAPYMGVLAADMICPGTYSPKSEENELKKSLDPNRFLKN